MSQKGKVALVTGGAQGIGRSFVENLLDEGASVSICDLDKTLGEKAASELNNKYGNKVLFLPCDVTNDTQFEDCFKKTKEHFSKIDIVVNNAGVASERDNGGWKRMIDINFVAVVVGTKLALKYLSNQSGGSGGVVINIASITTFKSFPSLPVYSATKSAVNQFSRSMGDKLYFDKTGVKVISLNPGMTKTALTTGAPDKAFDSAYLSQAFADHYATFYQQDASNLGKGLIKILKEGENGSVWFVADDAPARIIAIS